jgi:hypothetical protein
VLEVKIPSLLLMTDSSWDSQVAMGCCDNPPIISMTIQVTLKAD